MNNTMKKPRTALVAAATIMLLALSLTLVPGQASAVPEFDFQRLNSTVTDYLVIVNVKVELSFGMQTNETEQRLLGTIVSEDGLVVFDGDFISEVNPLSPMSSFSFRSKPTRIEIMTLDEVKYDAEYVGVDRNTKFAFARIVSDEQPSFKPISFTPGQRFRVGQWLSAYLLLPEFVKPQVAADVGMVATLVTVPEEFALIVGFSPIERASVLFDEDLLPVGMLGSLSDPSVSEGSSMMDSFGEFDIPLLGVITAERMQKLIDNPPEKGKADRAWLGITLQALTPDIAEFLKVEAPGGIIVNEVVPDSPADDAGLEVGDIIYEINGEQIDVDREEELPVFQNRISNMGAGAKTVFSVVRPGNDQIDTLQALTTLRAAPLAASDAPEYEDEALEFKARDLVFTDYMVYNVEQGSLKGVVVSELSQGGLANIAGLQIGDVIQKVDGTELESVDDLENAMTQLRDLSPDEVVLFLWRFGKTMFLNVKTN